MPKRTKTLVATLWQEPEMPDPHVGYLVITHMGPEETHKQRLRAAAEEWVRRMGVPSRDIGWGDVIYAVPSDIWRNHGILEVLEGPTVAFVLDYAEPVAFGEGGNIPGASPN